MMLQKPRLILFDFDDTIVTHPRLRYDLLNATLEHMGQATWSEADIDSGRQGINRPLNDSFPEIFGENWQEAASYYRTRFQEIHISRLQPLDGAEKTLSLIHAHHIPMAVVSNKTHAFLLKEIAHLGWTHFFTHIIGAGHGFKGKPSPDALLHVAQESHIATNQCWMIGDTEVDFTAAHAANMQAILFGTLEFAHAANIPRVKNHHALQTLLHQTGFDAK
jgi:phosphoglycolate phosphatase